MNFTGMLGRSLCLGSLFIVILITRPDWDLTPPECRDKVSGLSAGSAIKSFTAEVAESFR